LELTEVGRYNLLEAKQDLTENDKGDGLSSVS
jgi:hypothetical protein